MFQKKFLHYALGFMAVISMFGCTSISKESAGVRAQEYLSKYILKQGIKAKVTEVKDESGFYSVALQVTKDDQPVDKVKVYVTHDGKTLSLGPIFNLDKAPPTQEEQTKAAAQELPKKSKPTVDLFVMSGCPFGLQAEAAFAPVAKALGDKIDFTPRYVIYGNYQGGGESYCIDKANKYCSMHGAEEAREDVRQICIWNDQRDKWWDYINKFNAKCQINEQTPGCSKEVAKEVGIDYAKVESCLASSAESLLEKEVALNKKYMVEGSPTIVINGTVYNGGRSPNDILAAVCSGFKDKPNECNTKLEGGDAAPAAKGGCGR